MGHRARKLKVKTPLDTVAYSPRVQKKIPLGGVQGGTGPPNINLPSLFSSYSGNAKKFRGRTKRHSAP